MKKAICLAVLLAAGSSTVLGAGELGSIVSSFDATAKVGTSNYFPLGLAYDGAELWTGHSRYIAEWTMTGSRKSMYYLSTGISYDTAYDTNADRLYALNRVSSTYSVLCIDPTSGSIINSFGVPSPLTVPQGLTFGDGHLYIADMYDSRILKTTTAGSVVTTINPGVFAIKGLAWDGDTSGGPFLFACEANTAHTIHQINPATGSVTKSFDGPPFTGNILGLAWDGTYLWACQNYMGSSMYAFQFIAYEPEPAVLPTSLGKVKSLFR